MAKPAVRRRRRIRSLNSFKAKFFLFVFSAIVALILAETVVRVGNFDWRYVKKVLYYQGVDVPAHRPAMDPILLYELKPGFYRLHEDNVTVNSAGARGPERLVSKAPGIYRVVVIGASNVYGAAVDDADTWPMRLEKELNKRYGGSFEVWNYGVSAYVGLQFAKKAEIALRTLDPDFMIIALTNGGVRAFLRDAPVAPLFEKFPRLWFEFAVFPEFDVLSEKINDFLVTHWRTYRQALLFMREKHGDQDAWEKWHESRNAKAVRKYLNENKDKTQHMIFLCPAVSRIYFWNYYARTDVPVFELRADKMPREYREIHPPPHVNQWYAERMVEWFNDNNLISLTNNTNNP